MNKLASILQKVLPQDIPAELSVLMENNQEMRLDANCLQGGTQQQRVLVRIRVEQDGRVGEETTNILNLSSLRQALNRARKRAKAGRLGPLILTTTEGKTASSSKVEGLPSFQEQANELAPIADLAGKANFLTDARLTAQLGEYTIVNTLGLATSFSDFQQELHIKVSALGELGEGYGCVNGYGGKLEAMTAFLEAAAKCQASHKQSLLTPGEYTVILEPKAVADLMDTVVRTFFDGRAFANKATPLSRIGERLFSEQLYIWDDSLSGPDLPLPYDFEGVKKQRLSLVKGGVVESVCLDHESAARLKTHSTGHAAPPGSGEGAIPRHLSMKAGNAMLDDMIASTEKGILITHLPGIIVVDPRAGLITGTTAGGTLLVEEGKLTAALPDLRFVQDLILALNSIEMVGDETKPFGGLWQRFTVPALKLNRFSFLPGNPGQA